jgi:hypothetical protein
METSRERAATALAEWEDRKAAAHEASEQPEVGFYVTVRERPDGGRTGYLAGPWDTHEEALAHVEPVRRLAESKNDRARWYAFGTARVEGPSPVRRGLFNEFFGLPARGA